MLPMDETLMLCAIDLSGRPYFVMDCDFTVDRVGEFDTEMVKEFFYAVSYGSMMNLHLKKLHGENNHHMIEAAFKAFAKVPFKTDSLEAVSINLSIEKTKLLILGYAHKCMSYSLLRPILRKVFWFERCPFHV